MNAKHCLLDSEQIDECIGFAIIWYGFFFVLSLHFGKSLTLRMVSGYLVKIESSWYFGG